LQKVRTSASEEHSPSLSAKYRHWTIQLKLFAAKLLKQSLAHNRNSTILKICARRGSSQTWEFPQDHLRSLARGSITFVNKIIAEMLHFSDLHFSTCNNEVSNVFKQNFRSSTSKNWSFLFQIQTISEQLYR